MDINIDSKNLLIVGDWVIDEYWFLLRHKSKLSSHTGLMHFRMASKPNDVIADLCGAGHIARIIYEITKETNKKITIQGLGLWNERDTDFIKHLIHAQIKSTHCGAASLGYAISPFLCDKTPDINLVSLNPLSPTTRVIRQYQNGEDGLYQVNRIDWEIKNNSYNIGETDLSLVLKKPDFIIVHDLNKGVINNELIEKLIQLFPDADWIIRSKNQDPEWIDNIDEDKIILQIMGEDRIINSPAESWLLNKELTENAIEHLKNSKGKNTILLSARNEIILRNTKAQKCLIGFSSNGQSPLVDLGWSTAVSGLLSFQLISGRSSLNKDDLKSCLEKVNSYCGVSIPDSIGIKPEINTVVTIIENDWKEIISNWKKARDPKNIGIIEKDKVKRIEIWRGAPILPNYITVVSKKQEIINKIYLSLKDFKKSTDQTRSLSILLQADPGAGKTFLAKTLADQLGFELIRYDITQMMHRDDLLDLFETVATKQAKNSKKILVFVDEINARLEGNSIYGAFLTPLEENFYIHHGKNFSIQPCAWLFAGTQKDQHGIDAADKLQDFVSRMTIFEKIDYESLKNLVGEEVLDKEIQLEQVYLGASLLKSIWPDVSQVSESVLRVFNKINPTDNAVRKIRKLVTSLENMQYGNVTASNCLKWKGIVEDLDLDFTETDQELIRIITK